MNQPWEEEAESAKTVQMNIYQSKTYRKHLNWLYLDDKPRRQQMKKQHPYISVSGICLKHPSSNYEYQPKDIAKVSTLLHASHSLKHGFFKMQVINLGEL